MKTYAVLVAALLAVAAVGACQKKEQTSTAPEAPAPTTAPAAENTQPATQNAAPADSATPAGSESKPEDK